MRKYYLFYFFLILTFAACQTEKSTGSKKAIEEIKSSDVADFVRMPISANGEVDKDNVAKMKFEETVYHFGSVKQGTKVSHTYKFKNNGKVPLVITDARGTCGCTVPTYPKNPIAPGQGGEIKVVFDSSNFTDYVSKAITIIANTYPNDTELKIKGDIIKK